MPPRCSPAETRRRRQPPQKTGSTSRIPRCLQTNSRSQILALSKGSGNHASVSAAKESARFWRSKPGIILANALSDSYLAETARCPAACSLNNVPHPRLAMEQSGHPWIGRAVPCGHEQNPAQHARFFYPEGGGPSTSTPAIR